MERAHTPSNLAAASLIASACTVAVIEALRYSPDALIRVSGTPTWLDRAHVFWASAALPLSFTLVASAWLLLCGWVAERLPSTTQPSTTGGRLRSAAFAWFAVGTPAFGVAYALMSQTRAFKTSNGLWLALVLLAVAPLVPPLLRALARVLPKDGRRADALLATLSVAALASVVFATHPLALRYGLGQLLGFGLTTIGLLLAWTQRSRRPSPRASLFTLAACCALGFTALLTSPSRAALEHFHLTRAASWFARAMHAVPPDRDRDGYPARLGFLDGGDCDDGDAGRNPGAPELLGNGIDDNCFAGDATRSLTALRTSAQPGWAPTSGTSVADAQPPGAASSVLMVVLDSLRFERGLDGGLDPQATPAIARIASQAQRYAHFRTCAPRTRESVADLLGASFDATELDGQNTPLATAERGAIAALSRQGVHTAFIASTWLARYSDVPGWKETRQRPARYGDFADEQVLDDALAFLAAPPKAPFFLYVHFLGAHEPYAGDPDCSAAAETDAARYRCALRSLDRKVEALHAALTRRDPAQRTLFVLTADHGEELGEHGGRYHATTLYDEILHVPLLIAGAGVAPSPVNRPMGCFELLPTVLAMAGMNAESTASPCTSPNGCVQVARTRGTREASPFEPESSVVVLDGYKLLFDRRTGLTSYFNLSADPLEQRPLDRAPAGLQPRLLAHMDAWLSSQALARARAASTGPAAALAHLE